MKRMSPQELDSTALRLEEIQAEEERLRDKLRDQVENFGSAPPRAEKSKRLNGTLFQFTVTRGLTTELKDAEVQRIRQACPGTLFERLFRVVTKFKLADNAAQVLASKLPEDAPRNLRMLFSKAVETKETGPRLTIQKLEVEVHA